jgi:FtsZ-binding cell division protein ZapB
MIATTKTTIENTLFEVSELSKPQNTKALKQIEIDSFLDKVLDFHKHIQSKTNKINHLNQEYQKLTWFDNIDDECLQLIDKMLVASNKLHHDLLQYFDNLKWATNKGIATIVLDDFKTAIDDLKEYNEDLYSIFFELRTDADFINTTAKLENL